MMHCANTSSMAKIGANGQVYAVLLEGGGAKEAAVAAEMALASASRQRTASGGRCGRLSTHLGWSLLLAIGVTLVAVVTFQLWVTWHLQQKVVALQAQVDSLSALDLDELRSQLRDLYDLRDLNTERESGLPGHPTSADEDQVHHFIYLFHYLFTMYLFLF